MEMIERNLNVLECVCGCGKAALVIGEKPVLWLTPPLVAFTRECLAKYEASLERFLEKQVKPGVPLTEKGEQF